MPSNIGGARSLPYRLVLALPKLLGSKRQVHLLSNRLASYFTNEQAVALLCNSFAQETKGVISNCLMTISSKLFLLTITLLFSQGSRLCQVAIQNIYTQLLSQWQIVFISQHSVFLK